MSRRRDRERFESMKRLDPDYGGFRGHRQEPNKRGNAPLEAVTCTVCERRRNVPRGIALEQGDSYVCSACSERDKTPQPAEAREQD